MSRCYACNKNLSDYETTRKIIRSDGTVSYPDLCNYCFIQSDLADVTQIVERIDLKDDTDSEDTSEETTFITD